MIDFASLPVKEGFKGCFDYTNYNGGDTWLNQYADGLGIDFNMLNAEKNEGYILFPQMSGIGYLIDNIGDNFTVYAIIKGDKSTSAVSNSACWTITTFGADSSHRVYAGQFSDDNTYTFWSPTVTKTNESASEWHVIAYSVNNAEQKFYIDGELIVSTNTLTNFSVDSLCINTAAYNGAIPTVVTNSANVYVKYIGYATNNHSELQIQQNSDWLLEQYGLKVVDKYSKLAGADAAAIAYAIAKNNETMSALEDIIKSYREGVKEGDDGDGEVTEVIDEDGNVPVEPPMDEDDPDDVDLRGADVYYTVEGADGTIYYLRIYTLKETGIGSSDRGTYEYAWTYLLVYDLYDENGSAIKTEVPIKTYYSAYVVPRNVWYFKPSHVAANYVNTGYNKYMYVEKVRFTGESIVVHWVTVHAVNDEVNRGTSVTTVRGIPDGATIIHTSTSRPFTD